MSTAVRYTLTDLAHVREKAELIDGSIVTVMATGRVHILVARNVYDHLRAYTKPRKLGQAYPDNSTFAVPELTSGRESFSPDVALDTNPSTGWTEGLIQGPPCFAAGVRSPEDYFPAGERELSVKRDDYFEAGTLCVWDVNPRAETVTKHLPDGTATVFRVGDAADAEPAVPGWRFPVAEAFADLD